MTRTASTAGLLPALLLGSACVAGPSPLDALFLRPSSEISATPAELGFAFDELLVPVGGSRRVSIWHIRAAGEPKAIVVVVPGSDGNKSRYLIGLPLLVPHGYDVILMDYEGFGASSAARGLQSLVDDGFAVIDYALAQGPPVVAFGVSMGAPIVVRVAAERELAGCILEAPLILPDEPELYLRWLGLDAPLLWNIAGAAIRPLIPADFDILSHIRRVQEPKLILQSTEDDVTTYAAGERVFEAAPEPKAFWAMHGRHGEMIELDPAAYEAAVVWWIESVLTP
jgi:hypothetical protein